jgi:hypothetical protein
MKRNKLKNIEDAIGNKKLSAKLDGELKRQAREMAKLDVDIGELIYNHGKFDGTDFIIRPQSYHKKLAGRAVETDVNFRTRLLDLPEFRKTPWGRALFQFKSFDFVNTINIRNQVWREARHGNFMPLIYGLSLGLGSGAALLTARQLITKSSVNLLIGEPALKGTSVQKFADGDYVGGLLDFMQLSLLMPLPVNMGISLVKFGDIGLGPTLQRAIGVGKAARDFGRTGDPTGLVKEGTRQLSPLGNEVSRITAHIMRELFGFGKKKSGKNIRSRSSSRNRARGRSRSRGGSR